MTEEKSNVPAVRPAAPAPAPLATDTDSWVEVIRPVIMLADKIADTEFVPKGLRGNSPAAAAAMLYGREVGLPPMTALSMTHVVEGTPGISAEAMRALVLAAGHSFEFVESTGAICTVRGRRIGQENWTTVTWSIDMARAAGLLGKNNWKHYPRRMLQARATGELCEMIFPDVIHGFRPVEELEDRADGDDGDGTGPQPAQGKRTRVARKSAGSRSTAPKRGPQNADSAQAPEAPAGPPLPGELDEADTDSPAGPAERAGEARADGPGPAGDQTSGAGTPGDGGGTVSAPEVASDVVQGRDVEGDLPPAPEPHEDDDDTVDGEIVEDPPEDESMGEAGSAGPVPEPSPPAEPVSPRKASRAQMRMLFGTLGGLGIDPDDDEERRLIASTILRRDVASFSDLSVADATTLIDTLALCETREQLNALLDQYDNRKD